MKWSINGIELLLTLRDATDEQLFTRIKHVLPRIQEKIQAQRQEPRGGKQDESYCTIHQCEMTRSKDGKGYYRKAGEKPGGKAIWRRGN